uniref:Uncharacterized protein n=1 Tax=Lactuca sativa TaxID=4236 RepID=A0A9R1UT03_LACSA|nr:hypothetical protein LSAT_V11C800442470 [Lactuca sativa]
MILRAFLVENRTNVLVLWDSGVCYGIKMIDVWFRIVYYVLDHFNFESLKVEFEKCQVSVNSKSVHEMLGLPFGVTLLSSVD